MLMKHAKKKKCLYESINVTIIIRKKEYYKWNTEDSKPALP